MKNIYSHIQLFMMFLCLAACQEQDLLTEENGSADMKTPIVLTMGSMDNGSAAAMTRTVTDHLAGNYSNLPDGTHLFMYMQSDYDDQSGAVAFGGVQTTKYCQTRGVINTATSPTEIQFVDETSKTRTRYWEDAHARCSRLSIYAIGTMKPGLESMLGNIGLNAKVEPNKPWSTTPFANTDIEKIGWNVPNSGQSEKFFTEDYIQTRDLIFSNNIADYRGSTDSSIPDDKKTDRRLKFTNKAFEAGILTFYHALSKITVKIKKGTGFAATEPFAFTMVDGIQNIKLNQFNIWGEFDVKRGKFTTVNTAHASVMGMWVNASGKPSDCAYQLEALVLPYCEADPKTSRKGSFFGISETGINLMEFYIDNNRYQITSAQLFNAIKGVSANNIANDATEIPMEPGKNYEFTILVDKSKVADIEAKIIPWQTVFADATASNSNVKLSLKTDQGTAVTGGGFSLYRAAGEKYAGTDYKYDQYADYSWEKGYVGPATTPSSATDGVYSTNWYWPDNKTFYHFRTISPTGGSIQGNDDITYITMSGGTIAGASPTATDYQWGAPFKSGSSLEYDHTNGFCHNADKANGQIYKAIGATDDVIAITQFHMTSQVFVDLETSTGTDKVDLDGAIVTLTNLATTANLQLGNGLVSGHGSYNNVAITPDVHAASDPTPAYDYSYGVLPQKLKENGNTTGVGNANGTVGIKIKLTDGNEYFIEDLSTIQGTPSGENKQTVTTWDPGKRYYYKFKLTKTGIDPLYATIKDWEAIEATYDDIKIQ